MPERNNPSDTDPASLTSESFRSRRASRLGSPESPSLHTVVAFDDPAPAAFLSLALITAAIGLKGDVRARPLAEAKRVQVRSLSPAANTPAASLLPGLRQVWLRAAVGWRQTKLLSVGPRGNDFCLSLSCSRSRKDAESLIGVRLGISRDSSALVLQDPEQPVFWSDLVGRVVCNTSGESLGRVDRLETNGQQDWVVVGRLFIPLVDRHIVSLGSSSTPMVVDWEKDWV